MLASHRFLSLIVFSAALRADLAGAADIRASDSAGHASVDPAACAEHHHESSGVTYPSGGWWRSLLPPEQSVWRVRASAIGATALISIAPVFVLPFVPAPTSNSPGSAGVQQPALLCFAAGSMLGDVFLHILPHTLSGGHAHAERRGRSGRNVRHDHEAPHEHGLNHRHAEHPHEHEHISHAEGAHPHHPHTVSKGDASHGDVDEHGHSHHEHGHHESGHHDHDHDHDHDHGHSHGADELVGGLSVLGGFGAFFLVEKLVRGGHAGSGAAHSHGHAHASRTDEDRTAAAEVTEPAGSRDHGKRAAPAACAMGNSQAKTNAVPSGRRARSPVRRRSASLGTADAALAPAAARCDSEPPTAADSMIAAPVARTSDQLLSGYLNLAADAAHNFTDGLMLGAAFLTSWEVGVSATVACLAHEVPHEVCDVAVLMQAGFPKWRAIRAQLSTAVGAMLGTVIALATGRAEANLLLGFTAGGFMYVAAVDILPSVLHAPSTLAGSLRQVAALASGVCVMVAVTALEA